MRITSLETIDRARFVTLFNEVYSDYFWPTTHDLTSLNETFTYMNIDNQLSAVLWIADEPVGFALVARGDDVCWLYSLGICPPYRGCGYGKIVLEHILQLAKQVGMVQMGLEVLLQNQVARHLYRTYGFRRYCLLDSYQLSGAVKAGTVELWRCRSVASSEAAAIWHQLDDQKERAVVWSLRREVLLRRNLNWVACYDRQHPIGLLAYSNEAPLVYYRLLIEENQDYWAIGQALLAWVGKAAGDQYMINVNAPDQELQRLLRNVGFQRFMRQEYLICDLASVV